MCSTVFNVVFCSALLSDLQISVTVENGTLVAFEVSNKSESYHT